jgi:hypothetical protein
MGIDEPRHYRGAIEIYLFRAFGYNNGIFGANRNNEVTFDRDGCVVQRLRARAVDHSAIGEVKGGTSAICDLSKTTRTQKQYKDQNQ